MTMQESGEMYLETILKLSTQREHVRSIDVVEAMGFSKPAVSRAVKRLREDAYIIVDGDGYLSLTDKGQALAEKIYERHTILTRFLTSLGVDAETASADACKMEHDVSDATFAVIKERMSAQGTEE